MLEDIEVKKPTDTFTKNDANKIGIRILKTLRDFGGNDNIKSDIEVLNTWGNFEGIQNCSYVSFEKCPFALAGTMLKGYADRKIRYEGALTPMGESYPIGRPDCWLDVNFAKETYKKDPVAYQTSNAENCHKHARRA